MTKSKTNSSNTTIKSSVELLRAEMKKERDYAAEKKKKQQLYDAKEWYTIRALLGNQWANWFIMAGARER